MKFIYPFQAPQIYILLVLIQQNETKTGNAATKVKNMSYIPADKKYNITEKDWAIVHSRYGWNSCNIKHHAGLFQISYAVWLQKSQHTFYSF
jgi:hypothetical protein